MLEALRGERVVGRDVQRVERVLVVRDQAPVAHARAERGPLLDRELVDRQVIDRELGRDGGHLARHAEDEVRRHREARGLCRRDRGAAVAETVVAAEHDELVGIERLHADRDAGDPGIAPASERLGCAVGGVRTAEIARAMQSVRHRLGVPPPK